MYQNYTSEYRAPVTNTAVRDLAAGKSTSLASRPSFRRVHGDRETLQPELTGHVHIQKPPTWLLTCRRTRRVDFCLLVSRHLSTSAAKLSPKAESRGFPCAPRRISRRSSNPAENERRALQPTQPSVTCVGQPSPLV